MSAGFRERLVNIATREARALEGLRRGDPILRAHIAAYGDRAEITRPSAIPIDEWHYSAAFISSCVREAGASTIEFPSRIAHAAYVADVLRLGATSPFAVRDPALYGPRAGDLIHVNRAGGRVTFGDLPRAAPYLSESAIVVKVDAGSVSAVMGNDANGTVSFQGFPMSEGALAPRTPDSVICVLECVRE